jgi:hypothetical protein
MVGFSGTHTGMRQLLDRSRSPRAGEEIYTSKPKEGAVCWKYAINMPLGSQIVQITHSLARRGESLEAYFA